MLVDNISAYCRVGASSSVGSAVASQARAVSRLMGQLLRRYWLKKNLLTELRAGRPFSMRDAIISKMGPLAPAFLDNGSSAGLLGRRANKDRKRAAAKRAAASAAKGNKGKKGSAGAEESDDSDDDDCDE
jgi:hypothetical protein